MVSQVSQSLFLFTSATYNQKKLEENKIILEHDWLSPARIEH